MPRTTDEARERWNQRYETEGFIYGVEPNRFVAEHLSGLPPGRVLDLGSGQGRNAVWLALQGHRVTAVDLSAIATEQAKRLAAEAGVDVEFVTADLGTWDPPRGAFDVVLLSYLQLPAAARFSAHAKAAAALAPGGLVFLIAHHADNLEHGVGGPQEAAYLFSEDELKDDFAVLDIERLEQVRRTVDREDVSGEAIDVLMLARRPG